MRKVWLSGGLAGLAFFVCRFLDFNGYFATEDKEKNRGIREKLKKEKSEYPISNKE